MGFHHAPVRHEAGVITSRPDTMRLILFESYYLSKQIITGHLVQMA
jgi:hypothetical protein